MIGLEHFSYDFVVAAIAEVSRHGRVELGHTQPVANPSHSAPQER